MPADPKRLEDLFNTYLLVPVTGKALFSWNTAHNIKTNNPACLELPSVWGGGRAGHQERSELTPLGSFVPQDWRRITARRHSGSGCLMVVLIVN